MTEDIFESVVSEQNGLDNAIAQAIADIVHTPISFTRKTLYCPMCIYKMEIMSPEDTYTCPSCGAWFEMLSYGDKYKIE